MSEKIKPDQPLKLSFCFESLGVKFEITSNRKDVLEKIKTRMPVILPIKWRQIPFQNSRHRYEFIRQTKTGRYSLTAHGQIVAANATFREAFELLTSNIRLTIAEFAEQKIFLHAGVVGLKNAAVLIPGKSFAGKTTLVAEFVRRGFTYFSDEYALLDKKGLVHPFPKKLSIRGIIDEYRQTDFEVEQLGGTRACVPLPVKFILLTEYKKGTSARISETSIGEGLMQSIANSISVRQNPQLVLEVLKRVAAQSRILKGKRGEASEFIKMFVEYIANLETRGAKGYE